jgi:hypothetical protein
MSDVVELNPLENDQLICDLARYSEGVLTERQLRRKHAQTARAIGCDSVQMTIWSPRLSWSPCAVSGPAKPKKKNHSS